MSSFVHFLISAPYALLLRDVHSTVKSWLEEHEVKNIAPRLERSRQSRWPVWGKSKSQNPENGRSKASTGREKLISGTRTGFWIQEIGFWIPGRASGYQERVSGYQEPGFWIPETIPIERQWEALATRTYKGTLSGEGCS